jgi:hypothetical protein
MTDIAKLQKLSKKLSDSGESASQRVSDSRRLNIKVQKKISDELLEKPNADTLERLTEMTTDSVNGIDAGNRDTYKFNTTKLINHQFVSNEIQTTTVDDVKNIGVEFADDTGTWVNGPNMYLPERGRIVQKLWKVRNSDTRTTTVSTIKDIILTSVSTELDKGLSGAINASTDVVVASGSITTGGSGSGLTLTYTSTTTEITSITVTNSGSNYQVGDTLTVLAAAMAGRTTDLVFILNDEVFPGACWGIVTDTSDDLFSKAFGSQRARILSDAPDDACEIINLTTMDKAEFLTRVNTASNGTGDTLRDISTTLPSLIVKSPGRTSRLLKDIVITDGVSYNDPALTHLTDTDRGVLKAEFDKTVVDENARLIALTDAGIFSTAVGPHPNLEYSDFKRLKFSDGDVTMSFPIISWDPASTGVSGIPLLLGTTTGPRTKTNQKHDGYSYIVDMGGQMEPIRQGAPNPLPAHRYFNNGPSSVKERVKAISDTEGAIQRYNGGKTLGINTTSSSVNMQTNLLGRTNDSGELILDDITIEPMTALWKLDKGSFEISEAGENGNEKGRAGFYTVFAVSRPPAAGFMGVPLAPKHNKFGRGHNVTASGASLANGNSYLPISTAGVMVVGDKVRFVRQNEMGARLTTLGVEISNDGTLTDVGGFDDDTLKGLSGGVDGHGMALVPLLRKLEELGKVKGTDYYTIPADATSDSGTPLVLDILIPAGKVVPQITYSVASLIQFANGKFTQDGGPARFQAGVVPFLGDAGSYTPQWHINWAFYNGIGVDDNLTESIKIKGRTFNFSKGQVGKDDSGDKFISSGGNSDWSSSDTNLSNGSSPPGTTPSDIETKIGKFNSSYPDTFDPVQMKCLIGGGRDSKLKDWGCLKGSNIPELISDTHVKSRNSEIGFNEYNIAKDNNDIFTTDAPAGAMEGWVKFLLVNCPLPVTVEFDVISNRVPGPVIASCGHAETKDALHSCGGVATEITINGTSVSNGWIDDNKPESVISKKLSLPVKFVVGDTVIIKSTTDTKHGVIWYQTDVTNVDITGSTAERLLSATNNLLADPNLSIDIILQTGQGLNDVLFTTGSDMTGSEVIIMSSFLDNGLGLTTDHISPIPNAGLSFRPRDKNTNGGIIAKFKIKDGMEGKKGIVMCSVHGTSMWFPYEICM